MECLRAETRSAEVEEKRGIPGKIYEIMTWMGKRSN